MLMFSPEFVHVHVCTHGSDALGGVYDNTSTSTNIHQIERKIQS